MTTFDGLYQQGKKDTADKTVVVCGMVRDCGGELARNIPAIKAVVSCFQDYRIAVLENNSIDDTKDVLRRWAASDRKVHVSVNDFDETKYGEIEVDYSSAPHFRLAKIQKYVDYRNRLFDLVDSMDFEHDYLIVVDLDVARIDAEGVMTSFGYAGEWDAITANGYSHSVLLRRRYHDTYPLCEYGRESLPQRIDELYDYRSMFAPLRKGMPFVRVFSAYGGLAIYRRQAVKGLRYKAIANSGEGIQTRCEHFSICLQMAENGYDKVFINPNMEILYQRIDRKSVIRYLRNLLSKRKEQSYRKQRHA
ncbi:MAG: hypothetical protein MJY59_00030 [Bacteroidaceae bacterium]|nr:hypothetical protein [Bacteroidaceae bacterium]